jgi:hypothetical protein
MKVTPVSSPTLVQQTQPTDKRAAAIAAFEKGQSSYDKPVEAPVAQEIPPIDPNQVSAEEMSALSIPAPQVQESQPEVEQPVVEEKKEVDPQLSKQFAHLAKQAKQLRAKQQQQEQAFKQREAELAAKEAALGKQPSLDGYVSIDELKRNPLGTLTRAQVTYDELTQQLLSSGTVDPRTEALIKQQESRIAQLEAKIEEGSKKQVEAQDQAYKAAVRQIEVDARNLIKNDPNFETIKSTNSIRDVVELITETYKKDGIVLSVEEAATEVENYLVDEAMKLTRIGKIKSKLAQAAQPKPVEVKANKQTQPSPMKTLTNAHSTSRQLSARERAILAFRNELK